ncbi:putative bifunctional diguanylate cyclase/phosphodiesterase [Novosphingobium album (ex Liu et al. 2023)]|uniref:GGDEF domain-containing protein n=1 Tax=Novosphingobium album (ex Liu et al. 2023) TaxID=3031130 RepID=A0ABT5WQE7_9SPHN|nr:GGDEF domain-containing protein [Novosphingobium album (ex Liu et al. 2023)]MDE8652270.1 GGDEF domain-containing protein [Novosphingobium album (ex Liu et al. 2023)]
MIARGVPLADVTDEICRGIETRFPDLKCSVLLVDASGTLRPLSAPSLPDAYSQSLDSLTIGPNVGSCGTAAYTGAPVEVIDISTDPRWRPFPAFRDATLALGLVACWSSPVVDPTGVVLATFAVYFAEKRGPRETERQIVSIALHLCDLALARHRRVAEREHRANTDALTSLPNRGSFARALSHLPCGTDAHWAILLIDLDNLKTVNDTFGHASGDRLLQEVAARLAAFALPDGVFRIGGDEFAIILKDLDRLGDLEFTAAAALETLEAPVHFEHFTVAPQATMGGAMVTAADDSPDRVQHHADLTLYHAKDTHRGGFVRYWPAIATRMASRRSSIESVDAALKGGRLRAWYQPIVSLADGRIVGLEALCRMVTPAGEIIPAQIFAEATRDARIAPLLTRHMLSAVREDMADWLSLGLDFGYVSVNVTAVDLRGGRLQAALRETVADDALLERLVLEISESVYISERDSVVTDAVSTLRSTGLRIALDDFGTGYASLTHLLDLPVDFIKIDQSFIARLPDDGVSATIIAGLLAIARELGATVLAEGIEVGPQAERLRGLGCQFGQGFYFSPAVDRHELARLLMRHSSANPHSIPLAGRTRSNAETALAQPPGGRRILANRG